MEKIKDFACGNDMMSLIAFVTDPSATKAWMDEAMATVERNQKILDRYASAQELKALEGVKADLDDRIAAHEKVVADFKIEVDGTREGLRAEREQMLKGVDDGKARAAKIVAEAQAEADELVEMAREMRANAARELDQARTLLAQAKKGARR